MSIVKKDAAKKKTAAQQLTDNLNELMTKLKLTVSGSPLEKTEAMLAQLNSVPYIQFPVSFCTVDMCPITYKMNQETNLHDTYILLGRKHKQVLWQFLGGFRDPLETNEFAAARELHEEGGILVDESRMQYIGSLPINDSRYNEGPHKITTSVHTVVLTDAEADLCVGGDDIAEVKWYRLADLIEHKYDLIRAVHYNLFDFYKDNIAI